MDPEEEPPNQEEQDFEQEEIIVEVEEIARPIPDRVLPLPREIEIGRQLVQLQHYQEHVAALVAIAEAEESFLGTIEGLNHQNRRLEDKINDADAQNNLLQMQLKVLNKKMENLEHFMTTLNEMKQDAEGQESGDVKDPNSKGSSCLCPRCGFTFTKKNAVLRRSESFDREVFADCLPESVVKKRKYVPSDVTNPLMIDLVVAKIMSCLSPPNLLKCRLVNQLWNEEASFALSKRFTFTLDFNNIEHISRFGALPSSSGCLFTKVKIDLGFVVNPFRKYLEEFFETYGPSMTHLSLICEEEFANRIYSEEFRTIFLSRLSLIEELELSLPTKITERQSLYDDLTRSRNYFVFPHLKSLVFKQFDNSGGYGVHFTKEVLKMAPNLRSLRIETHSKEVVTRILLALGDREVRNTICAQLKHLFLDAFITQQHLEMLSEFECQLESLQISCLTVEVTSQSFEGLLTKRRNSLKSLIIGDYQKRPSQQNANSPLLIKLPVMPRLSSLTLIDPIFPDQRNLLLTPLNYSSQLPNLRRLIFDHEVGKPSGAHYFSDLFNSPCHTLRELVIRHGLTDLTLIPLGAKMFPNLVALHIANISDPILQQVWNEFGDILELYLTLCPLNVNVDSVLTGVPQEVCKKIQERNMYTKVEALDVLDIIRTEPSICNLKRLRTLRIDGLPSTLLTAVTGYLAFSQMTHLTSISIKSDVATISRECRRVLGERLNLTQFELF